jgi:hypothetical protein
VAPCAFALATMVGCGVSDRPPEVGDFETDAGASADQAAQRFQSTAPAELTCNLGPDGGVCACTDETLLGDPPTLYFVLDRSGSMADENKWPTIVSVLANLVVGLGPRADVAAAVFPAPDDTTGCTPGVEVSPPTRGDSPAGHTGPAATALLTILGHIAANGGTPTAATLESLTPRITSLPGKTYVILATDGGPNCNASAACTASGCELNIENAAAACTPGGSHDCCSDPAYGSALSCLDAQPTIDSVKTLAARGVPVYVIGVPGSAPYADLLNSLAQAGGTARNGETQYYAADSADQATFSAVLSSVAAKITGSCSLTLDHVPPDPLDINVFLDEQVLAQTGANGWTLAGQTVTLLGASCQEVLNGDVVDVRVVAGCPTLFK